MLDARYYCPQCDKKCEAIRQQKIKHAPPVLNLQLLRFVYDLKTFTKKKLQVGIYHFIPLFLMHLALCVIYTILLTYSGFCIAASN